MDVVWQLRHDNRAKVIISLLLYAQIVLTFLWYILRAYGKHRIRNRNRNRNGNQTNNTSYSCKTFYLNMLFLFSIFVRPGRINFPEFHIHVNDANLGSNKNNWHQYSYYLWCLTLEWKWMINRALSRKGTDKDFHFCHCLYIATKRRNG